MKNALLALTAISLALATTPACKKEPTVTPAPAPAPLAAPAVSAVRSKSLPGARVFIVEPTNGQAVSNPVTVKFGIEGMELAKAGEVKDGTGHHHLLIDTDPLSALDQPLPFSDKVLHFGQAQTEASIILSPGTHTLQLLLAGGNHIPHDPPVMSEKINITVP